MPHIIDGKKHADTILCDVQKRIEKYSTPPTLCVILVGDDPASHVYVGHKERACHRVGITSRTVRLDASTTQDALINTIKNMNADASIHGILVQMPLPDSICATTVIDAITPEKDVDGLHSHNMGQLFAHTPTLVPCTPKGCLRLIEAHTDIAGKHAVVVGRSVLVGRPMAALLLRHHATVTIAHRHTRDLSTITQQADILVVAVGKPHFITRHYIKPGAVVIDVGITRVAHDGGSRLVGDVDFDNVHDLCAAITPVPGGVGPMTVASLMENVVYAYDVQMQMQM